MKKYTNLVFISILIIIFSSTVSFSEEGMYPLSEIHKLKLKEAGLKIDAIDVYNPNGISLIDALVKVGGCTGSFVSDEGLILTNHHCAFGSISRASTPEHNYLENGFLAETKLDEISAKGITVRITESYEDVSEQILEAIKNIDDLAERTKIIEDKMDEIAKAADDSVNSIEGRVSEMFIGKTYILFKYRIIKDVRIVYAPPRSIGEFGGETDNWIWPRHTGDFTFMRAYVAPDGSAAEYSENNIPFKPKKFLKVNPNGVEEGDFTFILGYPGRTYRHLPSYFLEFQENYQLPYISKTYDWMIDQLGKISADNTELQLKFASTIKRLANTTKNYKGKLKGLKRINLVEQKQNEEKEIQNFIENNSLLNEKYKNLLPQFEDTYNNLFDIADAYLWFRTFNRYSNGYLIANLINEYADEMQKPEEERKSEFKSDKIDKTKKRFNDYLKDHNNEFEKVFLKKMISDALKFNGKSEIKSLHQNLQDLSVDDFVNQLFSETKIFDLDEINNFLEMKPSDINDSFLNLVKSLDSEYKIIDTEYDRITGSISKLSAELYEVKKEWKETGFIPDANGTLRLTYGYIKGYSPADAVYMSPITTLDGVIDKSLLGGEYAIPDKLKVLYDEKDFGQFYEDRLESVPVGILYNMDTTGGNSGSPIMNANGEMIGINFDRAFEATINDFAWNESYSRSIGVDIRYVLWITQKLGGADYLLSEMGVN
ncbi:MAG: S46 family peptidase [Ignavibacteriales bacterium]|nr:S46 family peptidase [Ignavibacteriales bacterium]MCB9259693.1 S46 family peptidase [Ignavibacteriales bacterium]